MGMFDDIECKYTLPLPQDPKGFVGEVYFQTKNFECSLDKYQIREDGTLWIHRIEYEYPENYEFIPWTEISSHIKEKKSWWEPVNVTKNIRMYSYIFGENDYDYWIDYDVTFIDGKITKVNLEKFETHNNSQRKIRSEENSKKLKSWIEYTKTNRYKHIHKPYNLVIRFTFTFLNKLIDRIKTSLNILERLLII
jgi:hypothetical protein